LLLLLPAILSFAAPASAQEISTPASTPESAARLGADIDRTQAALDSALRRIDELEARVDSLSGQVDAGAGNVSSLSSQLRDLESRAAAPAVAATPAFTFQPYGYIKLDMIYDDSRTSGTDYAVWVLSESPGFGSDKYFSVTVRQTRLGVNILGPDFAAGKQSGKVEIDFYAPASSEAKPEPMLRQAWWQLAYPDWNILVGQAGEVMSPLFPTSLNYAYLAHSGAPGYRKPLVRYQRNDKLPQGSVLQSELAVVRGIGSGVFSSTSLDDQGSDAGWPVLESHVGLSIPTAIGRPFAFGVSGHYGQEEYDRTALSAGPPASIVTTSGKGAMYSTYSGNLDWKVPLAKEWDFTGEFFSGRNLDAYMAGAGQGVNTGVTQGTTTFAAALDKGIDSTGGWSQLCYKPSSLLKWSFTVGAGIDDPDNSDLSGSINRSRNANYFTNAIYSLTEKTLIGVEVSYMTTDYKSTGYATVPSADGDNIRVQTSLQYNFQ
jgi:hypothetical protein